MNNINVKLIDETQGLNYQEVTSGNGQFAFSDLPGLMNYKLEADYNDDVFNGITTLDIVLIQKHILGLKVLDSPYKLIAADVDNSESVSGLDIIQLRKLLLGFYDEFPNNDSWRVIPNQSFINDAHPWPIQESYNLNGNSSDMSKDFISVKIGDVNLSRSMNFSSESIQNRNEDIVTLDYELKKIDGSYVAHFSSTELKNIVGLQIELNFDNVSEFNLEAAGLELSDNNYRKTIQGIRIIWNQAFAQSVEGHLFSVNFGPVSPDNIRLNQSTFKNEFYSEDEQDISKFNVSLRGITQAQTQNLKVYQNIPNPFVDDTSIKFEIPYDDVVKLEIRDTSGKLIYSKNQAFNKGRNFLNINKSELKANSSILFYSIISSQDQVTKKMILL